MADVQMTQEQFDRMVLEGKATWWEMKLPSGNVICGAAKYQMLGYTEEDGFEHFTDFTSLLHPDDHEKAMQAMRDHLEGKKDFYETEYRIRHKDGQYIHFYDCGKITEKSDDNTTIMGFVMKVDPEEDIKKQMVDFKQLILESNPSMIDLIKLIKNK